MHVFWSPVAVADLNRITLYIAQDNPSLAEGIATRIYNTCQTLTEFPYRNRKSRIQGKYDLVFTNLPYIVVYRIRNDEVEIIRVYHSAQNWP
jgi:toxin ParE1/3/4